MAEEFKIVSVILQIAAKSAASVLLGVIVGPISIVKNIRKIKHSNKMIKKGATQ